jgi:hypothetical protein
VDFDEETGGEELEMKGREECERCGVKVELEWGNGWGWTATKSLEEEVDELIEDDTKGEIGGNLKQSGKGKGKGKAARPGGAINLKSAESTKQVSVPQVDS